MYFKELHRILTIFRAYLLGYSHFTQTMLSSVKFCFSTYSVWLLACLGELFQKDTVVFTKDFFAK